MTVAATDVTVVIPTIGRPSLLTLLHSLSGEAPVAQIVVVDDRPGGAALSLPGHVAGTPLRVVRSWGRGPAGARNRGWRITKTS